MNDARIDEAALRERLREMLDPVTSPRAVLQDVSRQVLDIPQIQPRISPWRRFRGWLAPHRPDGSVPAVERTLVAHAPGALEPGTEAGGPARTPLSVSLPLAMAAVAVLVISGLTLWWSSPGVQQSPGLLVGASPTPSPALTLEPDTGVPRQIVVALDGSGHTGSLAEAVAMAREGDSILLKPGRHEASITISDDIEIIGDGGRDLVIVTPATSGPASVEVYPPFAGTRPESVESFIPGAYVFKLENTTARLSDLTVEGAEAGTAIAVIGGAPTLDGLIIDPVGETDHKVSDAPHESISFGGGTRATVRDSVMRGFVFIGDASMPLLSGNTLEQTCIFIDGAGSDPIIRDNTIIASACPNFAIGAIGGAAPTVEGNHISGTSRRGDGIRVRGAGSDAIVTGNVISGGLNGIWIGQDSNPVVTGNDVSDTNTGISVVGTSPDVSDNRATGNETGISVTFGGAPRLSGNTLCDNETNLFIDDASDASSERNDICGA